MKIHGKKIEAPNEELIVIPRGDGPPIVMKAKAVVDYDVFDKLCPYPDPPKVQRPGGSYAEDPEDEDYKKLLARYAERKWDWMYIQSLSATPGLEWEQVKANDPDTWGLWQKELAESGFCAAEIVRIRTGVRNANCLNEELVKKATQLFQASQQAPQSAR